MGTYIIEYDRNACIGAAVCVAVDEENWTMNADGKADLKNSTREDDVFIKEIDETKLDKMRAAAEGCPQGVIHIKNKETGEKIV